MHFIKYAMYLVWFDEKIRENAQKESIFRQNKGIWRRKFVKMLKWNQFSVKTFWFDEKIAALENSSHVCYTKVQQFHEIFEKLICFHQTL